MDRAEQARQARRHRELGQYDIVLAVIVVVLGVVVAQIAAGRPRGFVGVPVPSLQFLVVPRAAIARRSDPQSHKRHMLLAGISMIEAAVARWPFALMATPWSSFIDVFSKPFG